MPNQNQEVTPQSVAEKFMSFEARYREQTAGRRGLVDGLNLWQKELAVAGHIDLAFSVVTRAGDLFLRARQTEDFSRLLKSAFILARRAMKAEDNSTHALEGARHRLMASNILGWVDRGYARVNGGWASKEHAEVLELKAKVDAKLSDSFAAVSAGGVCPEVSSALLACSTAITAGRLEASSSRPVFIR